MTMPIYAMENTLRTIKRCRKKGLAIVDSMDYSRQGFLVLTTKDLSFCKKGYEVYFAKTLEEAFAFVRGFEFA